MKTNIVSIGNSQGVRIPKILLEQSKLSGEVELEVCGESIIINRRESRAKVGRNSLRRLWLPGETDDAEDFADWHANSLTVFDEEEW